MNDMLLRLKEVHVRYGPIAALRGVDLEVAQGEIVALLGSNGAGKSSLLGAIAGIVPVESGSILLAGEEVAGLPPEKVARHRIALVPEGRRVFPSLSVRDTLRIGSAAEPDRSLVGRRNEEVLARFPLLRERRNQLAGTLSGGQQQMLAIGRALMGGPRLLLLDEPSLGLAPIVMKEIFELIGQLRDAGVTILLVEQNAHLALSLADRAYVLAHGQVETAGSASHIAASSGLETAYLGGDLHETA